MKQTSRALSPFLLLALGSAGCDKVFPPPAPEPVPTPMSLPKTEVFRPDDYIEKGKPLPGKYRVVGVPSGRLVTVQTVARTRNGNQETVSYGTTETMRLVGIITQTEGRKGYAETIQTISNWTRNKEDLDIEIDPRYPWDDAGRRMIQLYFTPTQGPWQGQRLNLNRMLVRSGFAVVDLHQATSANLSGWLNDEVYARTHRTIDGRPAPLGLWKMGVLLGGRPAPSYKIVTGTGNSASGGTAPTLRAQPGMPGAGPAVPGAPDAAVPLPPGANPAGGNPPGPPSPGAAVPLPPGAAPPGRPGGAP